MSDLTPALFAASTVQAIGIVIAVVVVLGFVVYAAFNIKAGRNEVGAELELAANLKPYYDDDELETKKLDRTLTLGLAGLVLVGVGLPAYWLAEPGRQEGAEAEYLRVFESRGEELYTTGAQCNACHGPEGVGGVAPYTILDSDNEFVAQVNWQAPALNNVLLRYDRDEVFYILEYGRPYSPMPAWGAGGGGPLTEQQLENIIDYLASIQISSDESKQAVEQELRASLGLGEDEEIDYTDLATGEALFNLGKETGFAGGAYACGRCHTRGWSIDPASAAPADADLDLYVDYPDGAGGYGPQLRNGIIPRQFATVDELTEFLHVGAERGVPYGQNGLSGDGMMPGFGDDPNTEEADDGMLTMEMIEAIARYVESLGEEG
ncbi:MAG TPA: cytochrome c [Acidimicrobiales bacterium]|nr:cytochrome c [Acidimicrobiales bacterium]